MTLIIPSPRGSTSIAKLVVTFILSVSALAFAVGCASSVGVAAPTAESACVISVPAPFVRVGNTIALSALEGGTPAQTVVWSVAGSAGTITSAGLFTAPEVVPKTSSVMVEAACNSSSTGTATAPIPILPALPTLQTVLPASITPGGTNSFTVAGAGLTSVSSLAVNGVSTPFSLVSDNAITFQVNTPPWADSSPITITAEDNHPGGGASNSIQVRVQEPAVPFDAAARFLSQAGFGPTPSSIAQVQQMGMSAWIDAQLSSTPFDYTSAAGSHTGQWYRNSQNFSTVLRQRVSLALSHIYVTGNDASCNWTGCSPLWESVLENDAFENARQLLQDVSLNQIMGAYLENANNYGGLGAIPNQNFAREIMQLMTIGPDLLNPDGSVVTAANSQPVPAYTQDNIVAMSNALSGWITGPSFWNWFQPLEANEGCHNQGAKNILPGVTIPAGQGIVSDMNTTLDTLFNHPNFGPFLSRRLIQALVTSNPSPAYIARISAVFANDGSGTRGNLGAVVKAILLDPEARASDASISQNPAGGHLMEPILYIGSVMNTIGGSFPDDEVESVDSAMGEQHWNEPSVFSYFDPNHTLPDSTPAPEEQLMTSSNLVGGMVPIYGALHQGWGGFEVNWNTSPFWNCSSIAELVDRINHYLLHGQMTAAEQTTLASYANAQQFSSVNDLVPDLVFLVVSTTDYKVIR